MDPRVLDEQLARWEELELEQARGLAELAARARSPLARAVLSAAARDSEKHAELYSLARQLLAGGASGGPELEAPLEALRRHVDVELDAMKFLESAAGDPGLGPALRFVLKLILRDERLHHVLLYDLYQALVRGALGGEEAFRELYEDLDRAI